MSVLDDFDVRVEKHSEGTVVISVTGDLDMATAPKFEEALATLGERTRLVVDLSNCTFLDSAAIRLLASLAREAKEGTMTLSVVTDDPGLLRVLTITAVDTILPIHPSVEAALS